jgi:hypothetical protein
MQIVQEHKVIREAKAVLTAASIAPGQSFDSLSPQQVAAVRAETATAHEQKHGKPMPPNSWALIRKRYDLLQRRAHL